MTKREYFAKLKSIVSDNAELVAFIDHEVELLDKKNSAPRKPTTKQLDNEGYKATILANLEGKMTISEIVKSVFNNDLSNQKVSALVGQLVDDGVVVRTVEKRKAYFEKA